VNVVETSRAPDADDLVFDEVLYDPAADANCDGTADPVEDEFIEITNTSADAVELQGVAIWDQATFGNVNGQPRQIFDQVVIGPGETFAFFGGGSFATFDDTIGPWCAPLFDGDAEVLFGNITAGLALNNDGDTIRLTATSDKASTLLATFTYANGAAVDQSLVRNPDAPDAFIAYTTLAGALADRAFTPGTPNDGTTFADVPAP
jgi:hypothetical protein